MSDLKTTKVYEFLEPYELSEKAQNLIVTWITGVHSGTTVPPLIIYGGRSSRKRALAQKMGEWVDKTFQSPSSKIRTGSPSQDVFVILGFYPYTDYTISNCLRSGCNLLLLLDEKDKVSQKILSLASDDSELPETLKSRPRRPRPPGSTQRVDIVTLHVKFGKGEQKA